MIPLRKQRFCRCCRKLSPQFWPSVCTLNLHFFSLSLSSFALLHLLECLTNSDTEHEHLKSATHTKRKNNFDQNTKYLMTQRKIYKAKAKATFIEEEIENRWFSWFARVRESNFILFVTNRIETSKKKVCFFAMQQQHSAFILDYINGHKKSPWSTAHSMHKCIQLDERGAEELKCLKMVFSLRRRENGEKCAIIVITAYLSHFESFSLLCLWFYSVLFCTIWSFSLSLTFHIKCVNGFASLCVLNFAEIEIPIFNVAFKVLQKPIMALAKM